MSDRCPIEFVVENFCVLGVARGKRKNYNKINVYTLTGEKRNDGILQTDREWGV